jgi:hypothetical protein
MATAKELWVVYWLHNSSHTKPKTQGYIGVCIRRRLHLRIYRHRFNNRKRHRFTSKFQWEILFTGSKKECFKLERNLRPRIKIGWNLASGGDEGRGSGSKGTPKSPEHRAKLSAAARARYTDPAERTRMSRSVKKALKGIDRTGANNPMFGRHMSEETKEKIRAKMEERGVTGKFNPNYRHGRYVT